MAIKTFTSGEVLTASDTNTYLANAGLVFIAESIITAGSSTVTVSNCFSNTYRRYKIMIESKVSTGGGTQGLIFTPNVGNSGNYSSIIAQTATSATLTGTNSAAQTYYLVGFGGNNQMYIEIDNYAPRTGAGANGSLRWSSYDSSNSTGGSGSMWSTNNSLNTGFTFQSGGGYTLGAGSITVYGYRTT